MKKYFKIKTIKKKNNKKRNRKTRKNYKKSISKKKLYIQKGGKGSIPKIVHQIWFGASVPEWRKYLFSHNEYICRKCGYEYILWTEDKRTKTFFESTYGYQEEAIQIGKETEQSRWAQVADLARLEIIYKMGGIYIDSLFEIGVDFLNEITTLSNTNNYIFIGANEDPCGFNCKGNGGRKYLTNSFFAASRWCEVLERLLSEESLDDIDLHSPFINRTTGPYYLRSGITDEEIDDGVIYLFKTEQIYPFNVNASDYREIHPNICLKKTDIITEEEKDQFIYVNDKQSLRKNCLEFIKDNNSLSPLPLTIYHSGLGGTWSF